MSAWTDALAAIVSAIGTASGGYTPMWEDSAAAGAMRSEPRIDLRLTSADALGMGSVVVDPVAGTTINGVTWRLRVSLKITSDRNYAAPIPPIALAAQIRRSLQMDTALQAAWLAVGLSLESDELTTDLTGLSWDDRDYAGCATDLILQFVENALEPGAGTTDYFTRVQVGGSVTVAAPSVDVSLTSGPAYP